MKYSQRTPYVDRSGQENHEMENSVRLEPDIESPWEIALWELERVEHSPDHVWLPTEYPRPDVKCTDGFGTGVIAEMDEPRYGRVSCYDVGNCVEPW